MEGQNKTTVLLIECWDCGGIFEVHPESEEITCSDCLEEREE